MMGKKLDIGDLFMRVLKESNEDNFDQNMNVFMDQTAEIIGDFIGYVCSDPNMTICRFRDVLLAAAQKAVNERKDI